MKPERNLLILHTPGRQAISDWLEVQSQIESRAPDIEVRVASNLAGQPATAKWQVSRPSLVFSPDRLRDYRPRGGTLRVAHPTPKHEQARRLTEIGIRVPETFVYTPDFIPSPSLFGEYAVTKPAGKGRGINITLVRTADLPARYSELTFGGSQPTLVQPFIEHVEDGFPTEFRILTLFGTVLYCAKNQWAEKRRPLAEIAATDGMIASNNKLATTTGGRLRVPWVDDSVIGLAERACSAFPECAVLGIDIIREPATGLLYVLEVNPAGGVWHLSSNLSKRHYDPDYVRALYEQFGALDRTANLLIDKTRECAT